MGTGPEKGSVQGVHTKVWLKRQTQAARARAFKEWDSLVFSDLPQGIWEL